MERGTNKIINVFAVDDLLSVGIDNFLMSKHIRNIPYCILWGPKMKDLRKLLPRRIIYKAIKVITESGDKTYKYRGANWMFNTDFDESKNFTSRLQDLIELEEYKSINLFVPKHHLMISTTNWVNTQAGSSVYEVEEWQDITLLLERNSWENYQK